MTVLESLVSPEAIQEMVDRASKTPRGCFVEVGVYNGGTGHRLSQIAERQAREIYLYDTFEGIPYKDPIDSHACGDFPADFESVRKAIPYATVIKGIFPRSAVHMPPVAFAHLDCDQYRSVLESCLYLSPRMVDGGVIWFDDSPVLEGAHKAVKEVFGSIMKTSKYGKHYVEF